MSHSKSHVLDDRATRKPVTTANVSAHVRDPSPRRAARMLVRACMELGSGLGSEFSCSGAIVHV